MYFFRSTAKIFSQKNVKNYVQVFNKSTSSQFVSHDLTNVRSLVKIKGPDSNKYLQNLMTNDINLLNDEKKSIYAMFCNSRGRVIHDGIIYNLKESTENEYIVEVDKSALNDFLRLLKMYKIKKKVEVTSVDDQYKLFSITNSLESNDNQELKLIKPDEIKYCDFDPRYSKLGYRAIFSNSNINFADYFTNDITENSDLSIYKQHIYKHGIAENNDDIQYGSAIPLEYNIVLLNGVSFSKGCYLGQELIAKTHHTGVIRKRIMPIFIKDQNESIEKENNILNKKT